MINLRLLDYRNVLVPPTYALERRIKIDFSSLYPLPPGESGLDHKTTESELPDCDDDAVDVNYGLITPRMAFYTYIESVQVIDLALEGHFNHVDLTSDGKNFKYDMFLLEHLPKFVKEQYVIQERWRYNMLQCFVRVLFRLTYNLNGDIQNKDNKNNNFRPNCTGEQMALFILLNFYVPDLVEDFMTPSVKMSYCIYLSKFKQSDLGILSLILNNCFQHIHIDIGVEGILSRIF